MPLPIGIPQYKLHNCRRALVQCENGFAVTTYLRFTLKLLSFMYIPGPIADLNLRPDPVV